MWESRNWFLREFNLLGFAEFVPVVGKRHASFRTVISYLEVAA
jgi:hypothetical protein